MNLPLIAIFAVPIALAIAPLFHRHFHRLRHIRLNLRITGICRGHIMSAIGDKFIASIAPTNAEAQPAVVSNVVFTCDSPAYTVTVNADGTATYVATVAGDGNAVVTATSAAGVSLTDTKPLPTVAVAVDPEATALNLSVAAA